MRQLHPVTLRERLVAQGVYTAHQVAGLVMREAWSIHQLPDAATMVRVDREDYRCGVVLLVEALRGAQGRVERFDAYRYVSGKALADPVKVNYTVHGDRLHVTRTVQRTQPHYAEMVFPAGAVLHPPAWVFVGRTIRHLAAEALVVTADEQTLAAQSAQWMAFEADQPPVDGATCYRLMGAAYNEASRFWVDAQDRLVQAEYVIDEGVQFIRLEQYVSGKVSC